jgi:hypothetical protein
VLIEVEMVHDYRVVRLNAKHRTDDVRPYMGDSIGWWEGDTLVVETTNIPQAQQFMGSWQNLKVTERFTRVGKNRLHYAFQVEDPTSGTALGRRVRVLADAERRDLRIRLPRGQLRASRHARRRPPTGSRAASGGAKAPGGQE